MKIRIILPREIEEARKGSMRTKLCSECHRRGLKQQEKIYHIIFGIEKPGYLCKKHCQGLQAEYKRMGW